jgi:PAS domain S-box-containing protein
VSQAPELFDLRVKARSLAYLFAAGALMTVLTLALPHDEAVMDAQLAAVGAAALVVAVGLYLLAAHVTRRHLHIVLAVGTAMVGLANHYTGTTALYPLVFSWAVLYAFYFFTLREALAHVALVAVTYAVLLVEQDPTSPAVRWLLAVGTPVTAGVLISRMLARLARETMHAEERERTLRQNEAHTRQVLDSAPDAFITLDRDGIIRIWNTAAEQVFGWAADEAVGNPMRELVVPPELRARHDERRLSLLDSEQATASETYEVEFVRRDGSRFPAEAKVSKVTVRDEVFAAGFVRDISEHLRREEEREILVREQAARAEAERVAEMVSGMQLLVDAALAHRTLEDIIADLVIRVRGVLDATSASIFMVEESGLVLRATSEGMPKDDGTDPRDNPFAARVASLREPILLSAPARDDLPHPGLDTPEVDSMIGVPLLAEGEVTGVLVVCASAPRHFDSEDLGLLRLAADRVALAIDHARVYQREHRIAETLQRSLLPERLPQLPGLSVAARYLPAAAEAEVGGDWYDVLPTPGGGVGLVMGDVAGKGLAAASMVGRLRSALRAYALEGHPPARVVEQLNRLTWTEGDESQMTTLLYVVVDAAENTVRWVNAGHLPPLLVVGDRLPHFLEGGGSVPLGVLPFPAFEEVSVRMEPGSTVVLYTDGLVEFPGRHIDVGMEKLAEVVRYAPTDPEELCDHVLLSLVPGGGAPDDVALLALRSLPMVDRFDVDFPTAPESLASMRALLRRWLRHAESSDRETAEIITACGEAATNTIEHAGGGGGAPFVISGRLNGHEVEITVRDSGAWRAPRAGDHGRGISLMEALMDSVEVTPTPEGTTVRMTRSLGRAQGNGEQP